MAKEIDQLNYKVILDDAEFNQKIAADLKTAENFNTQMSRVLDIKKQIAHVDVRSAKNAEKIAREQAKTAAEVAKQQEKIRQEQARTEAAAIASQQRQRREIEKTGSAAIINAEKEQKAKLQTATAQERLNRLLQQGNDTYHNQGRLLRELGGYAATYFSIYTVERFISSLVRVSGEFELQHQTLKAILRDADGADKIFNQLQVLAVKSPFSFSDLTSYAKQLSAFSVPMEELYDTTKMLADVSAGLGVDMNRIILAYGQIRSASFLRGQEVRQLTEAGIPILTELAKQFEEIEGRIVSAGEVFDKISSREVPFEMVEKVFRDMTSEGGKFYNMQEVQAETLKAKVKNLGDQYDVMLYQIGQAQDGLLKGSVSAIGELMSHWQAIGRIIVSVASGFGAYAAVLAAVAIRKKALMAIDAITVIARQTRLLGSLTNAVKLYVAGLEQAGKASKAAFAGTIVGLITAVAVAIFQAVRAAGELNRELEKIADEKYSEMNRTLDGFDKLVSKLEQATEGSQDYRNAIHELNSKYGEYLPNLLNEKNAYDEIARSADAARIAIQNKAYASGMAAGREKIDKKYGEDYADAMLNLVNRLQDSAQGFTLDGKALTENQARGFAEFFAKNGYFSVDDAARAYFGSSANFSYSKPYTGPYSGPSYNDETVSGLARKLYYAAKEYNGAISSLDQRMSVLYSAGGAQSEAERAGLEKIDNDYKARVEALGKLQMSSEEYQEKLAEYGQMKIQETATLYDAIGMPEKARKYRGTLAVTPTKGARLVQEALAGLGINSKQRALGLWADESTDFSMDGYYKDIDQQYKSVVPGIERAKERFKAVAGATFDKAVYADLNAEAKSAYDEVRKLQTRKQAIEAIAKNLGYSLEDNRRAGTHIPSSGKSQDQKDVETKIDAIKEIQRAYKDLIKDGFSQSEADALVSSYFSYVNASVRDRRDFWTELEEAANELEKFDKEAAARLRADIGRGKASEIGDQQKAQLKSLAESGKYLKKTDEFLHKIDATTKEVFGEGVTLAIRKALQEVEDEESKIQLKVDEKLADLEKGKAAYVAQHGEAAWTEYEKNAIDSIETWRQGEVRAIHDIKQERIKNLGNNFLTSFFKDKNVDISRLDKKSLGELEKILTLIKEELSDEDIAALIPPELVQRAGKLGITLDDIVDAIKAARNAQKEVVDDKFWGKIKENLDEIADSLEKLGEGIASFGGAGSGIGAAFSTLGSMARTFGELKSSLSKTVTDADGNVSLSLEGKMGIISTAVNNIAGLMSLVGNQIQENKEAQEEWELTVLRTELAYRALLVDRNEYKESNVFGVESPYKKAIAGVNKYRAAADELKTTLAELGAGRVQTGTKKVADAGNTFSAVGMGAAAGAAIGTAIGGWALGLGTIIGTAAGALTGLFVGLFAAKKTVPVYESLLDHYGTLLDQSEDADPFALNPKIIADYDKLDARTKEIVDHWDEIQAKMVEAEATLNETIKDIAGDMGTKLRDALVEAFRNGDLYSAIDTFHDYVTGVIEELMAQAIYAAVFEDMFTELQTALHDSLYDENSKYYGKGWQEIFADFEDRIDGGLSDFEKGMEAAREWGKARGYNLWAEDEGDSALGNGIKSITEDTANLLASYINAIRADLSYLRIMQAQGWADVKAIRALMPPPTVWEYFAKIEAHTYDMAKSNAAIAASNASILAELRSVITSEDGAPAIRALM